MRWLDGITDSVDMFGQTAGGSEGQERLVCCNPWGLKESDTTQLLNNRQSQILNKHSWPGQSSLYLLSYSKLLLLKTWTIGQLGKRKETFLIRYESTNFFCEQPDRKHFNLWTLRYYNNSTVTQKQPQTTLRQLGMAVFQEKLYLQNQIVGRLSVSH